MRRSRARALLRGDLLADVGADVALMQRESFGPLPIAPVDSDDEAITRMNASSLGLPPASGRATPSGPSECRGNSSSATIFMNRCDHVDPRSLERMEGFGTWLQFEWQGFDQLTRPKALFSHSPLRPADEKSGSTRALDASSQGKSRLEMRL